MVGQHPEAGEKDSEEQVSQITVLTNSFYLIMLSQTVDKVR